MSRKTVAGVPGKDPTLPSVAIELQGNTYHLAYDFNAICAYEDHVGENLLIAFEPDQLTSKKLRALLWAGLLKENPDLTLQQAGALFAFPDMGRVTEAVAKALTASRPEATSPNDTGEAVKS